MSPLRTILSLFMLFAVAASTSASSDSTDREILAVPVKLSKKSSKKSKRGPKRHSTKRSADDTSTAIKPTDDDVQRVTMQVRTALVNFDIDHESLTDSECMFFEDAWKDAFDLVYGEFATARSMIVGNQEQRRRGRSLLRGGESAGQRGRSLFLHSLFGPGNNWFDIFGLIEYKCRFCSHDRGYDDDDDAGIYDFGGDRRKLSNGSEENQRFEKLFCDMLHHESFEVFYQVEKCQVTFTV